MRVFSTNDPLVFEDKMTQELVYCGLDANLTRELHDKLLPQLETVADIYRFERLLLGPVLTMMSRGLRVSEEQLKSTTEDLEARIKKAEVCFNTLIQGVFGVDPTKDKKGKPTKVKFYNSPVKLTSLFFEWLDIPKGSLTTDKKSIESMGKNYIRSIPFCNLLLYIRDLTKKLEVLKTGLAPGHRLAGSYNIGGTSTGRFSSSEHPLRHSRNMQNFDPELRRICIADEGRIFINIDLKRAEAVGVAFLSGDESYIKASQESDIHTFVAHKVFGIPNDRKAADEKYLGDFTYRDMAKRGSHGTNYFGTPKTMASHLRTRIDVMENFQRFYYRAFPGIRTWQASICADLQREELDEQGNRKPVFITTPLGRRRQFWSRQWDEATWREAIAYCPQSLISDINKIGMYKVWHEFEPEVWLHAEGHDSILLSVKKGEEAQWIPKLLELLKTPVKVNGRTMLLQHEVKTGLNWGDYSEENPHGLREWTT